MIDTEMTYFDELEERGRQKGREEGKRETLLRQLSAKFGPLPEAMILRVNALQSGSELDLYLERLLTARSLGRARALISSQGSVKLQYTFRF
jgi:hypothetical protein